MLLASFGNPMQSPLGHGTVWMVPPFQALGICLKSPGSTTWKLQDGLSAIVHIEPNIFVGFPGFSLVPLGVLDLAKLDLDSQVDTFSGFPTKTTPSMVKEVSAMLVATWYRAPKLRTCKIHPQDCPQPLPLPANLQQSVTEFLSMTEKWNQIWVFWSHLDFDKTNMYKMGGRCS